MRPDIEWRIGEEADEETVVRPVSQAARWRAGAVLAVAIAGLGLGLLYSSIPEPPPRPTALPTPILHRALEETPGIPAPALRPIDEYTRFDLLRKTVEQEVAALADGAEADFLALQDHTDVDWLETQRQDFSAWERPPSSDTQVGAFYFYGENTLNTNDQEAWLDISQYRRGGIFRETRFYRWQNDHWLRVRPPLYFWSGASYEVVTPRFRVSLPQADQPLAADLLQRLEYTYQQICFDLACPEAVLTPTQPLRVVISPALARQQAWFELGGTITLHLPSPRVSGLLYTAASLDRSDPVIQMLYSRLSEIIARAVSGANERWSGNSNGAYFMNAVAQWEFQRRHSDLDLDAYLGVDLLKGHKLTLPKYLWDWPVRDSRRLASPQAQANSVVAFIDRSFGAERVVYFLGALHAAQSLPQAIEAALPISYGAFEQQWQTWLETKLSE